MCLYLKQTVNSVAQHDDMGGTSFETSFGRRLHRQNWQTNSQILTSGTLSTLMSPVSHPSNFSWESRHRTVQTVLGRPRHKKKAESTTQAAQAPNVLQNQIKRWDSQDSRVSPT